MWRRNLNSKGWYPNWCGTMPMCILTFLEHYDLTGKRIAPLCTNEGSGMGRSEGDLKKYCKGAQFLPGLQREKDRGMGFACDRRVSVSG